MSRTYRRTTGNRWWLTNYYRKKAETDSFYTNEFQTRDMSFDGNSKKNLKDHSNRMRRSKQREQLSKVYRCEDVSGFDFVDTKKLEKGLWWSYW